ncbi:hypothetical protein BGW39_007246 [Mortierella sp. 14UC]|nr:hypothetical protein BGW39_007246 [Mortierella sp. 14UC]
MPGSTQPELEDDTFIAYLFERIFFESVARLNTPGGTKLFPVDLAIKLGYISRFYAHMSLKPSARHRGAALNLLGLNTISGVTIYMTGHLYRFKVLPDSFTKEIRLNFSSENKVCICIFSPALLPKEMVEIRRRFMFHIPENYREEIDYLMGVMRRNGLWEASAQLKKNCQDVLGSPLPVSCQMSHEAYVKKYLEQFKEDRSHRIARQRLENELIGSLKTLTSWGVEVLSSSAKGINTSDFDLELVMTYTRGKKLDDAMNELLFKLTDTGYQFVHLDGRYSDELCQREDEYIGFYDSRSELTCQITLADPTDTCRGGIDLRDMMQAYADIDCRVEPFIFAVQKILDKHGRSHRVLSNLAVTMIAIHYLQFKSIIPQLLSHQDNRANFEFYSGPVDKMLPEDKTVISDERMLAEWPKDAPPMAETLRAELDKKRYRRRGSRAAITKKRGIYTLTLQELWEAVTEHRMSLTDYDKELAKVRPFDQSPSPLPIGRLLIDFFRSTAVDFKQWETLIPVSGNPGWGSKNSVPSGVFTGLVVQDPFVLQLNLASQCTGWRFMSTSRAFQRADETISGVYRRHERIKEGSDKDDEEECYEWASSSNSIVSVGTEDDGDEGLKNEKAESVCDYFDGFRDALSGSAIKGHAKPVVKSAHRRSKHRHPSYVDDYDGSSDDEEEEWISESGDDDSESDSDMDRSGSRRATTTVVPRPSGTIMNTDDGD